MSDTQITWVEGMQFIAESAGHSFVIDAAPGFGRGTGMEPMRMLLLGAAGCSAMDVVHILKNRMRKQVSGLKIEVTSEQADQHPRVYTRIELNYRVRGAGLKERNVRRAIELSMTKFCGAAIMLGETAEIVTSYEIEKEN
jgi:putative redox protein